MENKELDEELTKKISGGVVTRHKCKIPHDSFKSYLVDVKCAKCGYEFKYFKDGRRILPSEALQKKLLRKRTCLNCGYVNTIEELGI